MSKLGHVSDHMLPGRIAAYFARNPDEMLTYADAALKFDCDLKTLGCALTRLRKLGKIKTEYVISMADKR
jgi:hypothetical protein